MLDPEGLRRAQAAGKAVTVGYGGFRYVQFLHDFENVPRGTALFEDGAAVIYGYPAIGRLLALETGLARQFAAPFWMEEKVDGFNVRICRVHGRTIALTRGGYVCPFTTDRLADLMDTAVFEAEPDLVLCAEVAGPENPYCDSAPPFIEADVRLFVFDLCRRNSPRFLSGAEKQALLRRYGLPSVASFGRFEIGDLPRIRALLRQLDAEGREGAVFKEDSHRQRRAKYYTASGQLAAIASHVHSLMDLPPEYFTGRVLGLALAAEELGLPCPGELRQRLGAAWLDGLQEAIRRQRRDGRIARRFRCRFRSPDNARELIHQLKRTAGHHLQIVPGELYQEGELWRLEFERIYPSLNGLLSDWLAGRVVLD
ncbi:Putative ATP-dependent DNA ligase [Candidatus Methylocalor cossyra]|uniref:ATP-dependent DNA ligase n=1 Tax=Candidatus Methylocalor cossyra TaxID=3108543 RepID=A0ABP1C5B9_9GAMM